MWEARDGGCEWGGWSWMAVRMGLYEMGRMRGGKRMDIGREEREDSEGCKGREREVKGVDGSLRRYSALVALQFGRYDIYIIY